MKAQVYDTYNFPAYAVCPFEYGNPLDNEEDNQNLIEWEMSLRLNIFQAGYRLASIGFGESEFFSNNPCFGLPCNCVDAVVYVEKL